MTSVTDERPEQHDDPEPEFAESASAGRGEAGAYDDEYDEYEEPEVEETRETAMVEVRRTPKYWNFMLLFGVLFGIVITIITYSLPYDADTATYSRGTVYGFALVISVAVGLGVGAVIALLAERVSRRSIRVVEAEHFTGRLKDDEGE